MDLVEADGVEIRDLTNGRPVVGMIGRKERRQHGHRRETIRAILVILPALVQHHVALVGKLRFRQRRKQVPHSIGFHPQRELQRIGWNDFPVIGPIGVGRSVQRRASALERLKVSAVVMLRSLEHQVLEEVREPCMARAFVLGSDVVPEIHRHDRARVVLVQQNIKAIGQRVLAERDVQRKLPQVSIELP